MSLANYPFDDAAVRYDFVNTNNNGLNIVDTLGGSPATISSTPTYNKYGLVLDGSQVISLPIEASPPTLESTTVFLAIDLTQPPNSTTMHIVQINGGLLSVNIDDVNGLTVSFGPDSISGRYFPQTGHIALAVRANPIEKTLGVRAASENSLVYVDDIILSGYHIPDSTESFIGIDTIGTLTFCSIFHSLCSNGHVGQMFNYHHTALTNRIQGAGAPFTQHSSFQLGAFQ